MRAQGHVFGALVFLVTFCRLRPIGSKKLTRRSVAGFARKAIQPRVSYHMTFGSAQNAYRLLSISALQKYFLRRHACAYKNTPARAHTHTRPCTQRRPVLHRPWQCRGASGPTACCHRAEPANAPKTGDYRRAQLHPVVVVVVVVVVVGVLVGTA